MRVRADVKGAQRAFGRMQRSIVPKAARNALNDTAFDVRKFVVETLWPRSFPRRRNARFPGIYFRVTRRATTGALIAQMGENPRYKRNFVELQIKGGPKIPHGRHIAVPTSKVKLTQRGPSKAQTPSALLQPGRGGFVADMVGRGPGIWIRAKRGRSKAPGKLSLMYVLEPTVHVDAAFPFFRLGYAKGRQVWPRHFERELRHALSRAR